jgi:putative toxin-antitoxin system antitoxin component (TIGR02293 family)
MEKWHIALMRVKMMALQEMAELLGGEKVIGKRLEDRLDVVELGYQGISKVAVAHLAKYLSLSWKQIAALLPVTERTLQRYGSDQHLSLAVSEQVLKIAEVVAEGTEVFGDKEKFLAWLNQPCTALSDNAPFSMLASRFGTEMVFDELGRIAHGVYS